MFLTVLVNEADAADPARAQVSILPHAFYGSVEAAGQASPVGGQVEAGGRGAHWHGGRSRNCD